MNNVNNVNNNEEIIIKKTKYQCVCIPNNGYRCSPDFWIRITIFLVGLISVCLTPHLSDGSYMGKQLNSFRTASLFFTVICLVISLLLFIFAIFNIADRNSKGWQKLIATTDIISAFSMFSISIAIAIAQNIISHSDYNETFGIFKNNYIAVSVSGFLSTCVYIVDCVYHIRRVDILTTETSTE